MHTFLSDGVLSPVELIRRAHVAGYRVMAITDHVGAGNLEYVLNTLVRDCAMASRRWDILALPGVEITHTPKEDIDLLAGEARALGAKVVNVHGETIVEPVEPGTNRAAVSSRHVNILAHPGLITPDEAAIAAANGVYLEISSRRGTASPTATWPVWRARRTPAWCWTRTLTSLATCCHGITRCEWPAAPALTSARPWPSSTTTPAPSSPALGIEHDA